MLKVVTQYRDALPLSYIKKLIDKHQMEIQRYNRLEEMYNNKNVIKHREVPEGNHNNKLSHGFAEYIVNTSVGYFMGKRPTYIIPETYSEEILDVLNYNDELAVNNSLAESCSVYGCAAELIYIDNYGDIRFTNVDIREIIYLVNPDIEQDIHTVIRHWDYYDEVQEETITYVELWDQYKQVTYSFAGTSYQADPEITLHNFNIVPFVPYYNNDRARGDFEGVIDLINAYDKAQSDTANDFEDFTDCYIEVVGAELDPEVARELKQLKVFNFPEQGGVRFVTKDINDTATENYKNRLVNDIHKFSGVPDMTDESFAGLASGVALKYKLLGLEYACSVKEAKFKKGLLRRLELIIDILKLKAKEEINVVKDIQINFVRNTIDNSNEIIDQALKLKGLISDEAILEMLSNIIDPEVEKERLEANREMYLDQFNVHSEYEEEPEENKEEELDE